MATCIHVLPGEVVELVFEHILQQNYQGKTTLSTLIRVCKSWNEIIARLIYSHVKLTPRTIGFFNPSVKHLALIKALTVAPDDNFTVRLPGSQASGAQHGSVIQSFLRKDFDKLTTQLRSMIQLVSVSVKLSTMCPPPGFETMFRCRLIKHFLRSLPCSVKDLELDTKGFDGIADDAEDCICKIIATLLPQLRHLKLSVSHMCPALFECTASHIKSVIVVMIHEFGYLTMPCMYANENKIDHLYTSEKHERGKKALQALLTAASAKLASASKCFQSLQTFMIISTESDSRGSVLTDITRHDLVARTSTTYPILDMDVCTSDPPEILVRVTDGEPTQFEDIATNLDMFVSFLTNSRWVDTVSDTRCSASLTCEEKDSPLCAKALAQRGVKHDGCSDLPRILGWELILGRTLIRPTVSELGYAIPPREDGLSPLERDTIETLCLAAENAYLEGLIFNDGLSMGFDLEIDGEIM